MEFLVETDEARVSIDLDGIGQEEESGRCGRSGWVSEYGIEYGDEGE